jgi:hypothetical protein
MRLCGSIVKSNLMFLAVIVFGVSADVWGQGSATSADWPLAGNWIATVPSKAGPLLLVQSIVPQDSSGTRFSTTMLPAKPNYTYFGIFPDAQSATPYIGHIEKTGQNTFEGTLQKYAMKQGAGPVAELVYIEVTHIAGSLVDEDTMTAEAKVAIFMPTQDVDADGFPDPGEEPQFCSGFSMTAKRQKLTAPYELTPSPMPFCEYGTGFALRLGAGQALWDQTWGGGPWTWFKPASATNVKFLGENVVGSYETTSADPSQLDSEKVVRFTYKGKLTISALAGPGSQDVVGQIIGDINGLFVADLNAERATFDEQGNIVITFGAGLHSEPDATITVVEKTGVFADIKQVGTWRWYMKGKVTIARVPDMALQQNIMAGLGKPELLVGADQEFVLTGWYYRIPQ